MWHADAKLRLGVILLDGSECAAFSVIQLESGSLATYSNSWGLCKLKRLRLRMRLRMRLY